MKKVLKLLIMSSMICFFITFVLILINSVMGVFVSLDYYFMMACLLTVCLCGSLVLFNSKKIFSKKKRVIKREPVSRVVRKEKQHVSAVRKRKIS